MEKIFCVYMLSNKWRGTIYTGMSGNLPKRGFNHKEKTGGVFSAKYNLDRTCLVRGSCDGSRRGLSRKTDQEMEAGLEG